MRTDKELLEILLNNIDKLETGLCEILHRFSRQSIFCLEENLLTLEERHRLFIIIYKNKPVDTIPDWYFWERGLKEPRIEFLKQLIEKYDTTEKS